MIKRILVPLDGSSLAESALPIASYLAHKLKASITLIHIIERRAPQTVHGERHLTSPEDAENYLKAIRKKVFKKSVTVERHVHAAEVEHVAACIVEHVQEFATDLIVMCTHGRPGPRTWIFGSIAQQVIAGGSAPVLVIHPENDMSSEPFACRRLLVPLDGNPDHEQGLALAGELAKSCGTAIHLLMIIRTFSELEGPDKVKAKLLPGTISKVLDYAEDEAETYLQRCMAGLQAKEHVVTAEVSRGRPAETIEAIASKMQIDLIVLATHGKTGLDAFWSGSLTPLVLNRSKVPMLLVPVTAN